MPILAALVLATAQATTPPLPANAATLTIYRDFAEPILFAPIISIDGQEFGSLPQKRRLSFALSPGRHEIEATWPPYSGHRSSSLELVVLPRQQLFVELRAATRFARQAPTASLVERNPVSGAAAIRCCRPPR